jgi:hypothetical protein
MNKILFFNKKIIPLHVYQTWSTHDLPPFMKKTIEHNQSLNPEFKFHLYDDDDCFQFIKNNFSADILNAYIKLKPGAYKADLWRYCVLYVNGGIYMDVKVKLSFNFSLKELIYSEHYVKDIAGPFDNLGIYNAFMVHAPKNTLLLKCIDQIVLNVYNKYYAEDYIEPHLQLIAKGVKIISAVKGMLPSKNMLLNERLAMVPGFDVNNYVTIMGPSHAEEVAGEKLSYLTFAGIDRL